MITHIHLLGYQGVDDIDIDPWGGMDLQVQKLKLRKKARKVGPVRIKPGEILGPIDDIRAREFDPAHCAILKKRLQATGSSNSKGVKLVVLNQALETAWLSASEQERLAMFTEGHGFHSAVRSELKYGGRRSHPLGSD